MSNALMTSRSPQPTSRTLFRTSDTVFLQQLSFVAEVCASRADAGAALGKMSVSKIPEEVALIQSFDLRVRAIDRSLTGRCELNGRSNKAGNIDR